jgi:outer membrane protein OmpA-like peptidoglycan-associated protein
MKKIFFLFFVLKSNLFLAQNLVKNPSFEVLRKYMGFSKKSCRYSEAYDFNSMLDDWKCSNFVTADILKNDIHQDNCFPVKPKTGTYMAGFIPYCSDGGNYGYHEQIQGTLNQALTVGKTYTFEYWVYTDDSLGLKHFNATNKNKNEAISVFCNNIGVQFRTEQLPTTTPWRKILEANPNQYTSKEIIGNTNGWKKIQFLMTADSAYQYFYIGNFLKDSETKINFDKSKTKKTLIAYYCLDNVSMREGNRLEEEPIFVKKSTYTFKNVTFQRGKAILVENSTSELDLLFNFLKENPLQKIKIQGHTDNTGNESKNLELSKQRAESTQNYLLKKGCEASRISIEGFGSSKPIAPNDSEEGKSKNRRVEVVLL